MKVEAHLIHWQEKDIMPYVIKHYKSFCSEIIVHDNHSKDGSAEMAKELGCTVIPFGSDFFNDQSNMDVKNNCWKGSNADFVFIADFDELPLFPHSALSISDNLEMHLKSSTSIFNTIGWQIISDDWPVHDLIEIKNGFEFSNYAKQICFSPKLITDIGFGPGAHESNPKGFVQWSTNSEFLALMYVLHYKHIGGVQRTIDRYKILQRRLSKNNRKNGWGIHYNRTPASLRQEWNERMAKSKPLI